jgi:hypothetical protein
MKIQSLCVCALLLTSQALSAATVSVIPKLLEKVTNSAPLPPPYTMWFKSCVIQADGVMVNSYTLGNLTSVRKTPLKLSLVTIKNTITKAALGQVTGGQIIVGGESTNYYAYTGLPTKQVVLTKDLYNTTQNPSAEAQILRNFINLNCGDALE